MSGAIAPLSGHPCYLCACADLARCCVSVLRIVTKPLQWARAIEGVQALGGSALARAHIDKVRTVYCLASPCPQPLSRRTHS